MVANLANESVTTVTAQTMIPDLFREHPHVRRVFDRYGLSGCGGPLGPVESVGFFARAHGVREELLLAEIIHTLQGPATAVPVNEVPSVADSIYRRYFLAAIALILTTA